MIPEKSASPPVAIEALPWDSRFFGKRIGRVGTQRPNDEALAQAVTAAREANLDCVYLSLVPSGALMPIPERLGFHLVDVQLELERRLGESPPSPPSQLALRPGLRTDIPSLRPVIDALAPWSRFAMDPRFGIDAARRMYEAWLEKSAESERELITVAVRGTDPVGVITVTGGPSPKIGLVGSSEIGAGIGTLLMNAAFEWALGHARTLSVTTQARNVPALRFYARHDFEIKGARYVYHLWLR